MGENRENLEMRGMEDPFALFIVLRDEGTRGRGARLNPEDLHV